MKLLGNQWDEFLIQEYQKDYFKKLEKFLEEEYSSNTIYPSEDNLLNALKLTDMDKVKVVIIGQDPYHEPNQAHGLAFSVQNGVKIPKSLINIYKEIESDLGISMSKECGNLTSWATQGVLLLNNVLTVRKGEADSHKKKGWEIFTDEIVKTLDALTQPMVFVFWGNNAKSKKELIKNKNHLVLEAPHPSPLSAYHGFFGCKHFSKINEYLKKNNLTTIDWKI